MGALTIVGIIAGIICLPLAIFGTYVGIKQIIQWRNDATRNKAQEDKFETLTKKVEGIVDYLDGLPYITDEKRKCLFNSGMKAMQEYRWDDAIRNFRGCLTNAIEPSEKVALLGLIGNCFLSTSRLEEAMGNYKEAEDIARRDDNKEGLSAVLGNMGLIFQIKGELDKALEHHKQNLEIAREMGNREQEANQLGNMGLIYQTKGELDKALEHHRQALAIAREIGKRESKAN